MKTKLRYVYFFSILLISVFFSSYTLMAQPGDPGGGTDPDNPVPIDGVSILLAAGGIYGAKKIYSHRKRKDS